MPPKTAQTNETPPAISTSGDEAICGPKVTDKVFATLAKIRREFEAASPEKQEEACGNLYGPTTYNSAWDIEGLDPSTSPGFDEDRRRGVPGTGSGPQATYDASIGGWKKKNGQRFFPWLTRYSNACAIPRPDDACAATVQFMGTCQHAQIVNYVMWGVVNKLCGVRLDRARTAVHLRGLTSDSELVQSQLDMTNIGYLATSPDQVNRDFLTTPSQFKKCQLKCPVTVPAQPPWNYIWLGLL